MATNHLPKETPSHVFTGCIRTCRISGCLTLTRADREKLVGSCRMHARCIWIEGLEISKTCNQKTWRHIKTYENTCEQKNTNPIKPSTSFALHVVGYSSLNSGSVQESQVEPKDCGEMFLGLPSMSGRLSDTSMEIHDVLYIVLFHCICMYFHWNELVSWQALWHFDISHFAAFIRSHVGRGSVAFFFSVRIFWTQSKTWGAAFGTSRSWVAWRAITKRNVSWRVSKKLGKEIGRERGKRYKEIKEY